MARTDTWGRIDINPPRLSAATRFARAGVPIVQTQKILGHASIEMTARVYTHLQVEDLRAAVEAIAPKTREPAPLRVITDAHATVDHDHGATA